MSHIFYYGFLYVISVLFNFQGSSCLLHGCHSEDDQEVSLRRQSSAGFGGPQLHEARRANLCTTYSVCMVVIDIHKSLTCFHIGFRGSVQNL